MAEKTFSISEALSFGWNQFKARWKFWIVVFILVYGISSPSYSNTINSKTSSSQNTKSTYELDTSAPLNEYNNPITPPPNTMERFGDTLGAMTSSQDTIPSWVFGAFTMSLIPIVIILLITSIFLASVRAVLQMGYIHLILDTARGQKSYYKRLLSDVSVKKGFRFLAASFLYGLLVFIGLLLFVIPGIYFATKYIFIIFLLIDRDISIGQAFKQSGQITKGVKMKIFLLMIVSLLVTLLGLLALIVGVIPASIVVSLAMGYVYVKLTNNTQSTV